MRLYLSSENFGKHKELLVQLTKGNIKVAYIGNAGDYSSAEERASKVEEYRQQFEELGFEFTEIDLREYFTIKPEGNIFEGYGLVWCSGGNTFLLRSALKQSGQDDVLVGMIKNDDIAYGGSSAGSVIAGPTLRGTEHGDRPEDVHDVYDSEVITEGLGLVPFVCIPHWGTDWFGDSALKMRDYLKSEQIPYQLLEDGQVMLLDGETQELLA